jgi:hypothetical protein
MFADYRVPQALLFYNVLQYNEELLEFLKKNEDYHRQITSSVNGENTKYMLERGHQYEVEIRGNSIHAVELLVDEIRKQCSKNEDMIFNAIVLDFYLWDISKQEAMRMGDFPIHLTRSIYY